MLLGSPAARLDEMNERHSGMCRALITGIAGHDGLYLTETLLRKGYRAFRLVCEHNNLKIADAPESLGNTSEAERVLGWRPRLTFEEIVDRMVEYDLERDLAVVPC